MTRKLASEGKRLDSLTDIGCFENITKLIRRSTLERLKPRFNSKKNLGSLIICAATLLGALLASEERANAQSLLGRLKEEISIGKQQVYSVIHQQPKNQAEYKIALIRLKTAENELKPYSKKLKQYENASVKDLYQAFGKETLLKIIEYKIQDLNVKIYGKDFETKQKIEAKKLLNYYTNLKGKLSSLTTLESVNMCMDALAHPAIAPEGALIKPLVAKGITFESKRLLALVSLKLEEKVVSQIGRFIDKAAIQEFEECILNGVKSKVSAKVEKQLIARSTNGVQLLRGNRKEGFDHIIGRHFTGEYFDGAKKSSMFPEFLDSERIVKMILLGIEKGEVVADGVKEAVVKINFKSVTGKEKDGIEILKVFIGDAVFNKSGKLIGGKVITAYPLKGSLVKVIRK